MLRVNNMDMVQDVKDFMVVMEQPVPTAPCHPDEAIESLRWRLVDEEVNVELREAWALGDMVGIADAIADSIYVLIGMALAYGIDLRPVWAAVQVANMAKADGPVRADGKRLKPEGWTPPDILAVLLAQGWDCGCKPDDPCFAPHGL